MRKLFPCLNFNGNAEEAFTFYKSIFGGEFSAVMRWKDIPGAENLPADILEKIMHIALPLGANSMIIASDVLPSVNEVKREGNNVHMVLEAESKEEADSLFSRLSEGGVCVMAMHDAFWGSYFGMAVDKFGIQWMILGDKQ